MRREEVEECYTPPLLTAFSDLRKISRNVNEVIRTISNFILFLRKDFTRKKSTKSIKSTKSTKKQPSKSTKSTKTQISE